MAGFTLYGMGSPNVLKVMLMLEELEQPYELKRLDLLKDEQREAAFLAPTSLR